MSTLRYGNDMLLRPAGGEGAGAGGAGGSLLATAPLAGALHCCSSSCGAAMLSASLVRVSRTEPPGACACKRGMDVRGCAHEGEHGSRVL
jgi:hypothetical protein